MGKDLRGKELGEGIVQLPNGTYWARFVDVHITEDEKHKEIDLVAEALKVV